jgi:hypothetical protein
MRIDPLSFSSSMSNVVQVDWKLGLGPMGLNGTSAKEQFIRRPELPAKLPWAWAVRSALLRNSTQIPR